MGFSRQEYWSGLPFPSPGDLPDPGIQPRSSTLQAYALTSETPGNVILNGLPWKWRKIIVIFEIASKYCISDSFVDYDGYFVSSKGFLPTVVAIMVSELNSPIPVHLSVLIPRMSMFALAISYWTTSNFSWFVDLTFQVPVEYCCLQHRTFLLSLVPSTTGCSFCFGCTPSFFLELFLHWSPVTYWAPTNMGSSSFGVISSYPFILCMGFSTPPSWCFLF